MDVHGNDNTPEWGWCETEGCKEPALPLWFSGGFPDDADLFLCHDHIGKRMGALVAYLAEIKEAAWIVQDDKGTRYCRFCEEREPKHYLNCILMKGGDA